MRVYLVYLDFLSLGANQCVHTRFAAGKGSALVIDVGKTMASITPVVDGFVLRKGGTLLVLWLCL